MSTPEDIHRQLVADSEAMADHLEQISAQKRRITVTELAEFEILYRKDAPQPSKYSPEFKRLQQLSNRFMTRIDPYQPLEVYSDDGKERITVLPPIFKEVNPLAKERRDALSEYSSLANHQMPHYREAAAQVLSGAIIRSQDFSTLEQEREHFRQLDTKAMHALGRAAQGEITTASVLEPEEAPLNLILDEDEDELE